MKLINVIVLFASLVLLFSCRKDEVIYTSGNNQVTIPGGSKEYTGFYLLNEGNMGMNSATIDYFSYEDGTYTTDIFSERNPQITKELGDVGNDILIYGNKAYATINVSNFVEVFNVYTGKHIAQIHIPNCRYLIPHNGKVYVSSYSGPVEIDPNAEKGFVAEIDTLTLNINRTVTVGYQPEEMVVYNNKLYVANSGGYRVPDYDTTVSVVDLTSFTETKKIEVAINLHRMEIAQNGDIYVSSRGDHNLAEPNLYVIDPTTDMVKKQLDLPVSNMTIDDNKLYYYASSYKHNTGRDEISYGILNTDNYQVIADKIITDGTDKKILIPYGIAINPETKEIFITDAQDYVGSGYIYCFAADGTYKWSTLAGNIPAHLAFVKNNMN